MATFVHWCKWFAGNGKGLMMLQHSFMINQLRHVQHQKHLSPRFYNVLIFAEAQAEASESVTNMQMMVWLRGSRTLPSSCGPQRNNTLGWIWLIIATHRESDLSCAALNRRGEGVTFPKLVKTLVFKKNKINNCPLCLFQLCKLCQ